MTSLDLLTDRGEHDCDGGSHLDACVQVPSASAEELIRVEAGTKPKESEDLK